MLRTDEEGIKDNQGLEPRGVKRTISTMAPVATDPEHQPTAHPVVKRDNNAAKAAEVFNPFYSPSIEDDGDNDYSYAAYKV